MLEFETTKFFERQLQRLPKDRAKAVVARLDRFSKNPDLPSLKLRPMKGLEGGWIINARHGDRIVLEKLNENKYLLADVGPHDNVYRRVNRR